MDKRGIYLRTSLLGCAILLSALWTLGNVITYFLILLHSFLDAAKNVPTFSVAVHWYFQGMLLNWPIYLSSILQLVGYAICGVMYIKSFISYHPERYIQIASIVSFVVHFQYVVICTMLFNTLPNCIYLVISVFTYIEARKWDLYFKVLSEQDFQSFSIKWPYWQAIVEYKKSK